MKNLISCSILLCLLSSCLEKLDPEKLKGSNWELIQLVGKKLPASAKATLIFNDSLNVSGKSFCNSYGGKVEISDNNLALKNVFGTKMFCQETASEETAYLNALNEADHAKIEGNKLSLLKGEQTLLIFKKVD